MWQNFKFSIVACTLVAILSLLPSQALPKASSISDKAVHFAMYFGIAIILSWESLRFPTTFRFWIISIITFCATYGILLECGQLFVPGRNFDWWDAFYNGFGGLVGSILFIFWKKFNTSI